MSDLIPRATLADIAAGRNRTLSLYSQAHDLIERANATLREAGASLQAVAPRSDVAVFDADQRAKVFGSYTVAARDEFVGLARHMVDAQVWSHVVNSTDLQRLMDRKAKEALRQQLIADPAEFTAETALATLESFAGQAGEIFRRGIAEVFSNLDRRFRSHDGFKIGSRVILPRAFGDFGEWNYGRHHRDTLQDIERTFHVLEGKTVPLEYAGVVCAIDAARRGKGFGAAFTEVETDYYRVRIFLNGNCHLWFKRRDLVEKVNKLLGEYYGEVIPDGRDAADDGGLHEQKRTLARNFGFFPSPPEVVAQVIDAAELWRPKGEPPLLVLEPSAGTGNIAFAAKKAGAEVHCFEIQAEHMLTLRALGWFPKVLHADFLDVAPEPVYDRVVMNPPFDRERDIDHVMHALRFLKPGGRLVSVMSAHTEFAETRKASAFREHVRQLGGRFTDLPRGSFSSVGTNVNALLLTVQPGRRM